VVTSSVGGRATCARDGSFALELDLPPDAGELELEATLEQDGRRLRVQVPFQVANPRGVNEAGVLMLGTDDGCAPHWRTTFGSLPGVDGEILTVESFDLGDGPELLVGGSFENAGGSGASFLARWNGTRWAEVPGAANGTVSVLETIDLGAGPVLYAGGDFTRLGGQAARIARWNGTSWDRLGAGFNAEVRALARFDDGNGPALYAAGLFTQSGGAAVSRIARWDGTSWMPLGSGVNLAAYALAVFDDGRGPALYVSGNFGLAGGVPAYHIARWDGTDWEALGNGLGTSLGDTPYTLAVFDDGNGPALYAGGVFTTPALRLARWDGARWSRVGAGVNSTVHRLEVLEDAGGSALYAAGSFTRAGGIPARRVVRWDGTDWSALGEGVDEGLETTWGLASHDDGGGPAVFVAGGFTKAGGRTAANVARWDGADWSALGDGLTSTVYAQAAYDDGSGAGHALYVGGFLSIGGTAARRVARWNGVEWSALGPAPGPDLAPRALAVFDDGSGEALYAGGQATGTSGDFIARWNGTNWSPLGAGTPSTVWSLAVFDDGSGPALTVGGSFGDVRRWNAGGWSSIGSLGGPGMQAFAQVVHDDGTGPALYVGGRFPEAGGQKAANIARWDGARWTSLGSGTDNDVLALASFDIGGGSVLIAGGSFETAGGVAVNHVARWDGTQWSPLGSGLNGAVLALTVFDDRGPGGRALYAGGVFAGGPPGIDRVARWDGERWEPLGSGVSDAVSSLFVFDDGLRSPPALCVGGFFASAPDSGDSFLALWQGWSCSDVEAPVLLCPASVTVDDPGAPGEVVTFEVTATDDLDPAPTIVCVPPSGGTFPPGLTIVQCKATDASGNSAECSFPVVVGGAARRR